MRTYNLNYLVEHNDESQEREIEIEAANPGEAYTIFIHKRITHKRVCDINEKRNVTAKPDLPIADLHNETPLQKASRLYVEGTKFKSLISGNYTLEFADTPKFKVREKQSVIYDYHTGYIVFENNKWAEIVEP